ncbi:MAG: alpha/beta hydrolase [Vicinamibacterales bacterium]
MRKPVVAGAVMLSVLAAVRAPAQPSFTATLQTSDGVRLAATVYPPARRPAPAVILVHMLTRNRGDWQVLASRLSAAGIGAIAIDLRGHGGSGSTPDGSAKTSEDLSRSVRDVTAAREFLRSRPDLFTDRIGIAGASVGANLAVLAAQNDESVRSLVLLSPGLDYRGLRIEQALVKYGPRPALIVVSQEDPYSFRSARRLAASGSGIREMRVVLEECHGTVMLERERGLTEALVDWFRRTLI